MTTPTAHTTQSMIWSLPTRPRSLAERPLTEWPLHERPTERMYDAGPAALSDAELLAIVLGSTGKTNPITLAGELLIQSGGWTGLQRLTIEEITQIAGMNRDRAARIKAALEVGRRLIINAADDRVQIRAPADVAQLLMIEMGHLDQEQLRVVLLDTKNRVQKVHTVYIGSLNSSMVRVGEVFKEAIRVNSAAVVICHNHPSNDPTPSPVIWRIVFVKWQSVADRRSLPILPDRSRPRRCARPPDGGPAQP